MSALPIAVKLCLDLPRICSKPIPWATAHLNHTLTLSRKQAAAMLAASFLCVYPNVNSNFSW